MEIGPYRLKNESTLRYNDGSWDEFANILFVDNPVGTGFSYVDTDSYVHELKDMADQMILFLKKFFEMFPEYEDNDVSIRLLSESWYNSNVTTALYCRRILRRATYTICSPSYSLQQQSARSVEKMEFVRSSYRERLDIARRAI